MVESGAIVDSSAVIHPDAVIKPYAVIGPQVEIGAHTIVESHAHIDGPTRIGTHNHIFSFAAVGGDPQDLTYSAGQKSNLEIGDHNIIREFCTINRGTEKQDSLTKIGSHNMLMSYTHVAHDCIIGNHAIMANNASLAGHVIMDDYVFLGGFTMVKQFCHLGESIYAGMGSSINKDVPPYIIVAGEKASSINLIGLKRRDFSTEDITEIKDAFKTIYRSERGGLISNILDTLDQQNTNQYVNQMIHFIRNSTHGIIQGPST